MRQTIVVRRPITTIPPARFAGLLSERKTLRKHDGC
jgi:hypothetical protein